MAVTSIIVTAGFSVCIVSDDANAFPDNIEINGEKTDQKSIIDKLDSIGLLEKYSSVPDDVLLIICLNALTYSDKGDGTYDSDLFDSIYIENVAEYLTDRDTVEDSEEVMESDAENNVQLLNSSDGGVDKLEKHHWGYRVYISKERMNDITNIGSGTASIISILIKLGVSSSVAIAVASVILGIILNHHDFNGIVFDIVTSKDVKIFGHTISIPVKAHVENIHEQ